MAPADDGLRVDEAAGRYEYVADDQVAGYIEYRLHGDDRIELVHTVVDESFEGRGIGSKLVSSALDDARSRGLRVVPTCPFVRSYVDRHPEYADLVTS